MPRTKCKARWAKAKEFRLERQAKYPRILRAERNLLDQSLLLPNRGGIPQDRIAKLRHAFRHRGIPGNKKLILQDEKLRADARNFIIKCRAEAGLPVENQKRFGVSFFDKKAFKEAKEKWAQTWAKRGRMKVGQADGAKKKIAKEQLKAKETDGELENREDLTDSDVQLETQVLSPEYSDHGEEEYVETQVVSPKPCVEDTDTDTIE